MPSRSRAGIRYAVHHARQGDQPEPRVPARRHLLAHPGHRQRDPLRAQRGVVVVAAAGNEGDSQLAYPAAAPAVISVGATTQATGCLADYSNSGPAARSRRARRRRRRFADRQRPKLSTVPAPSVVYQMTLTDPTSPRGSAIPPDIYGTSMSSPEVAATAALVIASGVIGRHPTPHDPQAARADGHSARGLAPNSNYGYGLFNAGAATASARRRRRARPVRSRRRALC